MIDPRLDELKTQLDGLVERCLAVMLALEKNPSRPERESLAAELQLITNAMRSISAEHRAIASELESA